MIVSLKSCPTLTLEEDMSHIHQRDLRSYNKNGIGSEYVTPSNVTQFSSIASKSALCVLGEALFNFIKKHNVIEYRPFNKS